MRLSDPQNDGTYSKMKRLSAWAGFVFAAAGLYKKTGFTFFRTDLPVFRAKKVFKKLQVCYSYFNDIFEACLRD